VTSPARPAAVTRKPCPARPSTSPASPTAATAESYALNYDVSWELDIYGRRRAANRAVNGDFAAARFAYEATRSSLAANVAQSYFEARGLAIQLEDARAHVPSCSASSTTWPTPAANAA
jgi:outer membrane protein TolC